MITSKFKKSVFLAFAINAGVFCSSSTFAGTVTGAIDTHSVDLEISCEQFPNGWANYRSLDPGSRDKDTNGDGYFFKATLAQGNMPVIFHAGDDAYKFGFFGMDVDPTAFEVSGTMSGERPEYNVELTITC